MSEIELSNCLRVKTSKTMFVKNIVLFCVNKSAYILIKMPQFRFPKFDPDAVISESDSESSDPETKNYPVELPPPKPVPSRPVIPPLVINIPKGLRQPKSQSPPGGPSLPEDPIPENKPKLNLKRETSRFRRKDRYSLP